jgi:hypothetical protein
VVYEIERTEGRDKIATPCVAIDVARGVNRLSLSTGHRLDVAALGRDGAILGDEIKVSAADLLADLKSPENLPFCDPFYFAIPPEFPQHHLPPEIGVIVADRFGGPILREATHNTLAPGRRKAVTLRFARAAAERLARVADPNCV